MSLPLEGRRVLDLSVALAGPWCTHVLASMGAEVIKIEPLGGDETRTVGPPFWGSESPLFLAANSAKRSVAIDLASEDGQKLVGRLAVGCDVFVQNLRPGTVGRLRLDCESLRRLNPEIVYCNIGAFGHSGPLKDRPGYDLLMQAVAGVMSTTGEADGPPLRSGPPIVDLGTGMWAAIGILGALLAREQDGKGRLVDTSLFETAVNWHPIQFAQYEASGELPPRLGRSGNILVPFEVLPTADGELVVTAGNDRLFERLCAVLDRADLAADPRFADNSARVENRAALALALGEELKRQSSATWMERFVPAGIPAGEVNDLAEVVADPQFNALGMFAELEHPTIPDLKVIAPPISYDGERLPVSRPAPALGADTAEVLGALGIGAEEIEDMLSRGLIRTS
ncbi:MAG: CaiB/BaiF CoA transferase family protein [Solirubrobacterales bacterium]